MALKTSVHSRAFNFQSYIQPGVDSRTGQYTVNLTLPDIKTNNLRGPGLPLQLSFSPLGETDSGFGKGWDLRLTQLTRSNNVISLHTGETFKCTVLPDVGTAVMNDKRLDSFHLESKGGGTYRVHHRSGLVEDLAEFGPVGDRVALPVRVYAQEGHSIRLTYGTFQNAPLLHEIRDDTDQVLLRITRGGDNQVLIDSYPDIGSEPLARYALVLENSRVKSIVLPTPERAGWRFDYQQKLGLDCISRVETPTGAVEVISYDDQGHVYPTQAGQNRYLPRVTRHVLYPGFGQEPVDTRYEYPGVSNFLGGGATLPGWSDDGRDNLYSYLQRYTYQTVEVLYDGGTQARRIERTFNRLHLMTAEKTTEVSAEGVPHVRQVVHRYQVDEGIPIEHQEAWCQLPVEQVTTWEAGERRRSESSETAYTELGNVRLVKHPTGVVEETAYYPVGLDPQGFERNVRSTRVVPAPNAPGNAPVLVTEYTYRSLSPIANSLADPWLAVDEEVLKEEVRDNVHELRKRTRYSHFEATGDANLHGRVQKQSVTFFEYQTREAVLARKDRGKLMGAKGSEQRRRWIESLRTGGRVITQEFTTTTQFAYNLKAVRVRAAVASIASGALRTYQDVMTLQTETVLETIQTVIGYDNTQKVLTLQDSILLGLPLLEYDDNEVQIARTYDVLGRTRTETVAPDTQYEATRSYGYHLSTAATDQAWQTMTDVKGVETQSLFDGANRVVREERDDADSPGREHVKRVIYTAQHDALGRMHSESEVDWEGDVDKVYMHVYGYDAWGGQRSVKTPDGVTLIEETDPIGVPGHDGPVKKIWQISTDDLKSGVTETWMDLFEKEVRILRYTSDREISRTVNTCDGLGRLIKTAVGLGSTRNTEYGYDVFDRLLTEKRPDQGVVIREYAAHSDQDLPIRIGVDTTLLGTQTFDGLGRRTRAVTGGREERFEYREGERQPRAVTKVGKTKAENVTIEYDYVPQLGEEPTARRQALGKANGTASLGDASYTYDYRNARLEQCTIDDRGVRVELGRDYFSTGKVRNERRSIAGSDFEITYDYSRTGRLLAYEDVGGQRQVQTYDDAGRLARTVTGGVTTQLTYDTFGRVRTILTTEGQQRLMVTLAYDGFNRELSRVFDFGGAIQTLVQEYNDVDGLTSRTLKEGATTILRHETFGYDNNQRLFIYECTGPECPVDPYGNTLAAQYFVFSKIDNITLVENIFADDGYTAVQYRFDNEDPAQLSAVVLLVGDGEHNHPPRIDLQYDVWGNLTRDEAGRELVYNALNQLLSVNDPVRADEPAEYRYDPVDKIASCNGEHRFYRESQHGGELMTLVKGDKRTRIVRAGEHLVAEQEDDIAANDDIDAQVLALKQQIAELTRQMKALQKKAK